MNRQVKSRRYRLSWLLLAVFAWPAAGIAQVAVPEIEELGENATISVTEIDELVGPVALYPDDLLAIVLPASTYPLQVVEAARFLEELENDSTLVPDEDWDDSIVALLNYPEVIELLNEDLDWTWRLGEAVVGQQSDVIAAIEGFRDRAYAAGNLQSDDYQLVSQEEGTIQITPVQDDVIYVPYYEPEQVVVYQPRPVYYYYPRAYPVYYYPYPSYYSFHNHFYRSHFWGVTTAFSIGWHSYHLNTFHHSFYGHPYYGRSYIDRWWYRRPDSDVYNNTYVRTNVNTSYNRYRNGDRWAPRDRRTVSSDQRITRTRYYPNSDSRSNQVVRNATSVSMERDTQRRNLQDPIQFRNRPNKTTISPSSSVSTRRSEPAAIAPRPRPSSASRSSSQPKAAPQRSSQSRSSQSQSRASKPQSQSRASKPQSQSRASKPQSQSRASKPQSRPSRSSKPESGQRSSRDSKSRSSRRDR
jgi:hypothetical protein